CPHRWGTRAVPPGLTLEGELPLDRVVAAQIDIDPDRRALQAEHRGLCDIGGRAGARREDAVDEGRRLAARAALGLPHSLGRVAAPKPPLAFFYFKSDGCSFDLDDFTDQRGEVGNRPALLPGKDAEERPFLFLAGALIDIDLSAPFAVEHVSGNEYICR